MIKRWIFPPPGLDNYHASSGTIIVQSFNIGGLYQSQSSTHFGKFKGAIPITLPKKGHSFLDHGIFVENFRWNNCISGLHTQSSLPPHRCGSCPTYHIWPEARHLWSQSPPGDGLVSWDSNLQMPCGPCFLSESNVPEKTPQRFTESRNSWLRKD